MNLSGSLRTYSELLHVVSKDYFMHMLKKKIQVQQVHYFRQGAYDAPSYSWFTFPHNRSHVSHKIESLYKVPSHDAYLSFDRKGAFLNLQIHKRQRMHAEVRERHAHLLFPHSLSLCLSLLPASKRAEAELPVQTSRYDCGSSVRLGGTPSLYGSPERLLGLCTLLGWSCGPATCMTQTDPTQGSAPTHAARLGYCD